MTEMIPLIGVVARRLEVPGRNDRFVGCFESPLVQLLKSQVDFAILPYNQPADRIVGFCDGLLLLGGEDISHASAWETGGPKDPLDVARDEFECELVRVALQKRCPVLGICRGMQILNYVGGGSLSELSHHDELAHMSRLSSARECRHDVRVKSDSILGQILGEKISGVVSRHRSQIDRLGRGFVAVAFSPDGVIEAIESEECAAIGVQWHAEMGHESSPALFSWLRSQAMEFAEHRE